MSADKVMLRGVRVTWRELDDYLWARDGGCIARFVNSPLWRTRFPMLQGLPDPGLCRSASGDLRNPRDRRNATREHVKDELGMSVRADHDEAHVAIVCWGHHVFGRQWCTQVVAREAIRLYIVLVNSLSTRYPPLD